MSIVPFAKSLSPQLPQPDPTYLAMAAAMMRKEAEPKSVEKPNDPKRS